MCSNLTSLCPTLLAIHKLRFGIFGISPRTFEIPPPNDPQLSKHLMLIKMLQLNTHTLTKEAVFKQLVKK